MEKKDTPINLCYVGNSAMFRGILLSSLSVANTTSRSLNLIILSANLTNLKKTYTIFEDRQGAFIEAALKKHNPSSSVRVIHCGELFLSEFKDSPNLRSVYTPYSFMRLLLDELDAIPDRLLYLDADTIALKDISELYDLDMSTYDYAMAQDQVGRLYFGKNYGNSGVLLLNLANIKKHKTFAKARKKVAKSMLLMPDQDALNEEGKEAKLILPWKFNEQKEIAPDTVIRHYCKILKYFPYVHVVDIKPWDRQKFTKAFGKELHASLFKEYDEIVRKWPK